jgi:polysaccharide export outer membrane protein
MFKTNIYLIIFFLMMNACSDRTNFRLLQPSKDTLTSKKSLTQSNYDYIVMPQDRLKVSIYRNPELTSTIGNGYGQLGQDMQKNGLLVDNQGYISLPLINKIKVAGLTQTQVASLITDKYKKYLKIPTVYVEVLNKKIYVIGEVKHPGAIKLESEKLTIFEALAQVGDLTDAAIRDNILIMSRDSQNHLQIRSLDLTKFDHISFANILLKPNDIVYVQPDGWKEYKVSSDNFTAPFRTISQIIAPFIQIDYLTH